MLPFRCVVLIFGGVTVVGDCVDGEGSTVRVKLETIKDDVEDSVTWPVRIAILILAGDYRYTSSLEVLLALRLQTYMNE
ncbi:hypothetical protein Tco_0296981 [Tanacetum coccineum]